MIYFEKFENDSLSNETLERVTIILIILIKR